MKKIALVTSSYVPSVVERTLLAYGRYKPIYAFAKDSMDLQSQPVEYGYWTVAKFLTVLLVLIISVLSYLHHKYFLVLCQISLNSIKNPFSVLTFDRYNDFIVVQPINKSSPVDFTTRSPLSD